MPTSENETTVEQTQDSEVEILEAEDAALPEDADLTALYDQESGNALYTIEQDGKLYASDAEGNPIPRMRPDPNPEEDEPPATEEEPKKAFSFKSPYDGVGSEDPDAELLETNPALYVQKKIDEGINRALQARDQQRLAARGIGISEDVVEDLAPRMARTEALVPKELKGTRQGAMTNVVLAALDEAFETDDLAGALAKIVGARQPEQPAKQQRGLLTPSQRTTSPRPNPEPARNMRGPRDVANSTFHRDGLDGDIVSILRNERKVVR